MPLIGGTDMADVLADGGVFHADSTQERTGDCAQSQNFLTFQLTPILLDGRIKAS